MNSKPNNEGQLRTEETLLFSDFSMKNVIERARKIAIMHDPVLITGETGTGKTLLAKWLHQHSPRSSGPFFAPGGGEFDNDLVDSALFGHHKGAFTDATSDATGLLVQANKGTLVLNDIDYLPLRSQKKLLRFLDDGFFYRLGQPGVAISSDVRLVLTTNKNLLELVKQDYFLHDLYYRISHWVIKIPALRDRPNDIRLLAHHYLNDYRQRHAPGSREEWSFSDEAIELFHEMNWNGNIRALRNAVENIATFAMGPRNPIGLVAVSEVLFDSDYAQEDNPYTHAEKEEERLLKVLKATNWNVLKTARITGLARNTITKRIKENGWEK